jgi:hypothetical protein
MLGAQSDIHVGHLTAACLAWSDINVAASRFPLDTFLGLDYSSGRDVRPANPASWKAVLSTGKTRAEIVTSRALYDTPVPRVQQLLIRG